MKKNLIFYALVMACLLAVLLVPFDREKAIQTASWGLHFSGEGQPPQGTEDAQRLKKLDGAYMGDPTQKVLYLTFDAGYENGNTEKILDILKKHQVPAAFFLVGNYMEKNKDLVRRMVEEGHIVGNHTMHHPDMRKKDQAGFAKELRDLDFTARKIWNLPKNWGIRRCFGALLMQIGTTVSNPRRSTLFPNCFPGYTTGQFCFCTAPPRPTQKFWMNF